MILYNYHSTTGELLGTSESTGGPSTYGDATPIAPPEIGINTTVVWNDASWDIVPDHRNNTTRYFDNITGDIVYFVLGQIPDGTMSTIYPVAIITSNKEKQRVNEIKEEAVIQMNIELPAINSIDEIELIREQWLSIAPAARNATVKFQKIIDIYIVAKAAIIDGVTQVGSIVWP